MCTRRMAVWTVVLSLSSVLLLEAQPGGRRGFTGGGMAAGVSPEQVFSLLAFDEKLNVTDKQLIALREVLKPLYVEQRQMMAEMFVGAGGSGARDFQAMREALRDQQSEMRDRIMGALATALTGEQIEALKAHLQQGQRQRGGPRGGSPRGGGPQGGGF